MRSLSLALLAGGVLWGGHHTVFAAGRWNPVADPAAVVIAGEARFTVLTPRLLRMEWSPVGRFEDDASLVFVNRRLPVPHFTATREQGRLKIRTDAVDLEYREGSGPFSDSTLRVTFDLAGERRTWVPGLRDTANLGGTTRTLDGVEGRTSLEPGLISRDGWVLVDDSNRPLFDDSDWPWVRERPAGERRDWYLFAHGHEYRRALADFVDVAGRIPMPPRFAFGLWWSRYWAYSDRELRALVDEFRLHDVPLDVLVVDMDWHETFDLRWDTDRRDQAGQRLGWTGYTWNRSYFPDPPGFLAWCEERGLRTTLNLHPASGIQPHEEAYPAMARAMGMDPASRHYVPFDIVDKRFAQNYLEIVLRPLERDGVDFWWLDWQQWGTTKTPGVTPTWWLNYVHFTDMERQGKARPLIFHRWGGLGNHRYQIGFSGDAISVWPSLRFQPEFTATAGNVGFGYWSHDIGGHMPGPVSAELFTRWIQWGAFSPILRTHTTKNPAAERRIWAYAPEHFRAMRDAIRFRSSLLPYIYTSARTAYDTGLSLCRPMYLQWPERPEAYGVSGQYMFGEDMLVAPVTDSITAADRRSGRQIWIPPGSWYEWCSGTTLTGPAIVERRFALEEIPVYVRSGAIIPMQRPGMRAGEDAGGEFVLSIVPGDSGRALVYEDGGNSTAYENDACRWTTVGFVREGRRTIIRIEPAKGGFPGAHEERSYVIRLEGEWPPEEVRCNGRIVERGAKDGEGGWEYDGDRAAVVVSTPVMNVHGVVTVDVSIADDAGVRRTMLNGLPGRIARVARVIPWLEAAWPREWAPDEFVAASQTGLGLSADPARAEERIARFHERVLAGAAKVRAMAIDQSVKDAVLGHVHEDTGGR